MKKYLLFSFMLMLAFVVNESWAQERTVSGKVTSAEDGSVLPGVNVVLKGTTQGTVTDIEGNYSISIPPSGGVLIYSFIGLATQEIDVAGRSVIDVQMDADVQQLGEVVVTAVGIERQKKSLGYATQQVDAEDLTVAANPDALQALSGKLAGVQINQSSGSAGGSASRIVIRGPKSFTGGNQPLFVIDGVPINNSQLQSVDLRSGATFNNAASDINPNDIESINVLKGPSAAALYGSRAANGVVVITTKSGKNARSKAEVTINSSLTFSNPLKLPNQQEIYAGGSGGVYNPEGFTGWGPKIEGQLVRNPNDDWVGIVDGVQDSIPLRNYGTFYDQLLRTGKTYTNSFSVAGGAEKTHYRLSATNTYTEGMLPETDFDRTSITLRAGTELTNKLKAEFSATYTSSGSDNIADQGTTQTSIFWQAWYEPVDHDVSVWKDYKTPDGNQIEYGSGFWNNPYWLLNENYTSQRRDRVNGFFSLGYDILPWISVTGKLGTDFYTDRRKGVTAINTVGDVNGGFYEDEWFVRQINTDIFASINKDIGTDFNISGVVGLNDNRRSFKNTFSQANAITLPGIYNFANIDGQPNSTNFESDRRLFGVYGTLTLGYKDFAFLEVNGRKDWSSTLPEGNNTFFYPSFSGSFIVTDAFPSLSTNTLSFLKLRGNWGQVGLDAPVHRIQSVFVAATAFDGFFDGINFPFAGVTGFQAGNRIGNPNLSPEITTSWEVGAELGLLDDRLTLDVSYFNSVSDDQIIDVEVPRSTGYSSITTNAGKITNKGIEVLATGTPVILSNGFKWEITGTFSKINNEVEEIFGENSQVSIGRAGFVSTQNVAQLGFSYPAIYGRNFKRNDNGDIIVNANTGIPALSEPNAFAEVIPDWQAGLRNTFSYKGISLSVFFEQRHGGSIYSYTAAHMRVNGFGEETLFGRDGGVVFNGVNEITNTDGSVSYVPNTTSVSNEDFWSNHSLFGASELGLLDASFIKLREVALGYNLPESILKNTPFGSVYFSIVGRNLWMNAANPYIDPETSGFSNADNQGFETAQLPTAKTWGFNLKLTL